MLENWIEKADRTRRSFSLYNIFYGEENPAEIVTYTSTTMWQKEYNVRPFIMYSSAKSFPPASLCSGKIIR